MSNDEKKERIQSQWGENRTLLSLTGERWNIKENIWQKIKINMNYIQAQSLVDQTPTEGSRYRTATNIPLHLVSKSSF